MMKGLTERAIRWLDGETMSSPDMGELRGWHPTHLHAPTPTYDALLDEMFPGDEDLISSEMPASQGFLRWLQHGWPTHV